MPIETLCGFVFGIHQHGKDAQLGARRSEQGIGQKYTAESFALIVPGHSQQPQARGGHNRISGQLPDDFGRQIG